MEHHGFAVWEADNAREGLILAAQNLPSVILLDLGLPDRDGVEVIRELRLWNSAPLIVLSARDRESDKIAALDAGADDYLTKPFGVGELMARLRVALRHSAQNPASGETVWERDELKIDGIKRQIFQDGAEIHLTPLEWKILALLCKNVGKVVTQSHILREVWGPTYGRETALLRVHVGGLRRKIERNSAHPKFLQTEAGVGYRLNL